MYSQDNMQKRLRKYKRRLQRIMSRMDNKQRMQWLVVLFLLLVAVCAFAIYASSNHLYSFML